MSGSALDPDANFDLFSYTDLELFPYVEPENRLLGTHANENFGLESLKNPENIRNERLKRFDTVVVGHKDDDRHRQRLLVLLELDVLVSGQQRVELGGGLPKQRTVPKAGPAHLRYGVNVVANQQVSQRPG